MPFVLGTVMQLKGAALSFGRESMETIFVTGGCGFIGSNYILYVRANSQFRVVNLDRLTYAGNPANLAGLAGDSRYIFRKGDICDRDMVRTVINEYTPRAVINFAAESHVDRSIANPDAFIRTNIFGTYTLLDEARRYWKNLGSPEKEAFRFLHISTDEVYGSLGPEDPSFNEKTSYAPNSPYSASKAASDHLALSYFRTYGLPVMITNCSNNYGPRQFPEKLIPLLILHAMEGRELPIYGDGGNIRDWLFVHDHVKALEKVLEKGKPGETYAIGGLCEKTNLDVAAGICSLLDEMFPESHHRPHGNLIRFVADRPGHDRRYAVDISKVSGETGWNPGTCFDEGIRQTIQWYADNPEWVRSVRTGEYRHWLETHYRDR